MTDVSGRQPSDRDGTRTTGPGADSCPDPDADWNGDDVWWSDDLHIPYVQPPLAAEDEQWNGPAAVPTKDDLRYRPAPAGSSREDRQEWRQAEGVRIADLLATVKHPRKAGLRVSAPRGLGRKGRKAFYATRSENVRVRRQRSAGSLSERELGILALVIILAAAVLVRVLFFGDSTPVPPVASTGRVVPARTAAAVKPPTPSTQATTAVQVAVNPADALAAASAWFTLTCPAPPSGWAAAQPLMTSAAWAAVNMTPPVVTAAWSCNNLQVRAAPDQRTAPSGGVIVRMNADRTITTGTTPTVTEKASAVRVVVNVDDRWLVDHEPAN